MSRVEVQDFFSFFGPSSSALLRLCARYYFSKSVYLILTHPIQNKVAGRRRGYYYSDQVGHNRAMAVTRDEWRVKSGRVRESTAFSPNSP
jgi:hypothetical protein